MFENQLIEIEFIIVKYDVRNNILIGILKISCVCQASFATHADTPTSCNDYHWECDHIDVLEHSQERFTMRLTSSRENTGQYISQNLFFFRINFSSTLYD